MYTLTIVLSLCLVVLHSFGKVEKCQCQGLNNQTAPTTEGPSGKEEKEEFKLTVTDKGKKVEERITIDKKKNTERFHVPSHNGADEADILNDFNRNLTMYRLPQRKMCYLLPLEPNLPSPQQLNKSLQQTTPGPEQTTTSEEKWKPSEEVKDRTNLSDEMAVMCAKYPIYRLKRVTSPVSIAKVRTKRCRLVAVRYCYIEPNEICNIFGCWIVRRLICIIRWILVGC